MSLTKKDALGREVYKDMNGVERYIFKYYEDTDKKKMIIKLINDEQTVGLYNRSGKSITMSNDLSYYKFDAIKVYNNRIQLRLPRNIRDEYLRILKLLKQKKEDI